MSAQCRPSTRVTGLADPILYSFRRCPYAMRARLALAVSGRRYELREVSLRAKPTAMLEISAKGTVPVLVLSAGEVIDESLEIMRWALTGCDPEAWLDREDAPLIAANDGPFKHDLDRYKYPDKHAADPSTHREHGLAFLRGPFEGSAAGPRPQGSRRALLRPSIPSRPARPSSPSNPRLSALSSPGGGVGRTAAGDVAGPAAGLAGTSVRLRLAISPGSRGWQAIPTLEQPTLLPGTGQARHGSLTGAVCEAEAKVIARSKAKLTNRTPSNPRRTRLLAQSLPCPHVAQSWALPRR